MEMSMTESEAIAKCQSCNNRCPQAEMACEIAKGRMYATDELIKCQKELEQYRAIGTVSEFRELKEKATAKKPKKIKRHRGGFEMEHCPNCDTDYQVDRRFEVEEDYCGNCGKLLDSSFINFCANCGCPVDMSKGKE